jgi:hypothetical protein
MNYFIWPEKTEAIIYLLNEEQIKKRLEEEQIKKQVRYLINHLRVQRLPKLSVSRVIVATIRSRSCWLQ